MKQAGITVYENKLALIPSHLAWFTSPILITNYCKLALMRPVFGLWDGPQRDKVNVKEGNKI